MDFYLEPGEKPRALVVDDDLLMRATISDTLESVGFAVTAVSSGSAALDYIQDNRCEIVFLDVIMPGIDGFETCRRMRKVAGFSHLPIVMVTGREDDDSIRRAYDAGATDFIAKPINHQILKHRAHYILRASRALVELKQSEERIRVLAYYDRLTGLPNQTYFRERFHQLVEEGDAARKTALFYLNLDRFKNINNTLGHASGDQVLQQFSRRFSAFCRTRMIQDGDQFEDIVDNLARLGGDEFCFWVHDVENPAVIRETANRFHDFFSEPYLIDGHEVFLSGSIGISVFPDDGTDLEQLLKAAHASMHFAKDDGKNRYQFYSEAVNAGAWTSFKLEHSLRRAMEREELYLNYQPFLDLQGGGICGAEALLRWTTEDGRRISPAEFIPLAEETGMIIAMGEWVLRKVCEQIRIWSDLPGYRVPVSVNFSPRQFLHFDFAKMVASVIRETGIDPALLHLELTESVIIQDEEEATARVRQLQDLGIKIAIDDFGTGYSSLSYLRRFNVDYLKIDKAFIDDICTSPQGEKIVAAIINMAHSLDLQVVAEGVEKVEQLQMLRRLGCNIVQGYYYSRPLMVEDFLRFFDQPPHLVTLSA